MDTNKATLVSMGGKQETEENIANGTGLLLPKVDFVFKKIFGDEKNKPLLADFLSKVLKIKKERIKDIKITDPALKKGYDEDKNGDLDVRLEMTNDQGETIELDIEIQIKPHKGMSGRVLFYWSKMYLENFEEGMKYYELRKTISIIIFDETFLPLKKYHSVFHVWEDEDRYLFDDALEIHVLEIQKAMKMHQDGTKDDDIFNWLLFLNNDSEEVCKMLSAANPAIGAAINIQKALSMDKTMRHLYTRRMMAVSDEVTKIEGAREDGIQEGLKEGLKEGLDKGKLEVARNLLAMGLKLDKITKATGFSADRIRTLLQ